MKSGRDPAMGMHLEEWGRVCVCVYCICLAATQSLLHVGAPRATVLLLRYCAAAAAAAATAATAPLLLCCFATAATAAAASDD